MNQTDTQIYQQEIEFPKIFSNVMAKVYMYMFLGLLVTGITSFYVSTSEWLLTAIFTNIYIFYGLIIAELLLVVILSAAIRKMSFAAALFSFFLYAFINGLTLSVVFLVYAASSVFSVFFVSCAVFGSMSLIGYTTKKDLTKLGSLCMMGLLGIIIAGIVNIFIQNDSFSFIVTVVGLLIFIGLTAYNTQKIKTNLMTLSDPELIKKASVMGALSLYLDFINIFLRLLRILGKRK